ncbi:MAG TPA: hypothetical protein VND64_11105 [Pirellulales bacterium]|nr:hypothetical protein [Pirellulales bacterium]
MRHTTTTSESRGSSRQAIATWTALAVAGVAVLACELALHGRDLPLGVPGQWAWERLPVERVTPWAAQGIALFLALLLAAWTAWGLNWIEGTSRRVWLASIGCTTLLVAAFQIEAESVAPKGLYKWATALYHEQISGPYWVARHEVGSVDSLLRHYNRFLAAHRPDHISTHPPGWFISYRVLLNWFDAHPGTALRICRIAPNDMTLAFDHIERAGGLLIPPADRATITVAALGSRAVAALVVLPIAWLVRRRGSRSAAWVAAAVAGLVPAGILFAPRSDTVYPTVAALTLAVVSHAVGARSTLSAAFAGLLLFLGMFTSLVFAAVAAFAGVYALLEIVAGRSQASSDATFSFPTRHGGLCRLAGAAAAGWLVGPLVLHLGWGHNVFQTWSINLAKNAEFYQHMNRTYSYWVCVNLIELAVALGLPAAVLLAVGASSELRAIARRTRFDALLVSWLVVVLLLNFSGKNLGEVARLWLFLMPLGVALAAQPLTELPRRRGIAVAVFVVLQALACLVLSRDLTVL